MECTLCIYIAQLADNFLKKNQTIDEIEQEFKLVCNYFPNNLNAECNSFIDEYGPYVIQLIAVDLEPEAVCTNLKLCGNPNPPKFLSVTKRSTKDYEYVMPKDFKLILGDAKVKNIKVKDFKYEPLKKN